MNSKLFIANLSYRMTNDDLADLFSEFGNVVSARIALDRETQQSKGFGFVEMENGEQAENAMAVNGREIYNRPITVVEARTEDRRTSTSRVYRNENGDGGFRR